MRDTNFYYSFLVLPPHKRRAIVAVWDFCRAVDDTIDVPRTGQDQAMMSAAGAAEVLDGWRREVALCYEGRTPETAEGRRLQPFVSQFSLPRRAFEDLIDGVAMDIGAPRYAAFSELHQYCLRVASAVGLICVEIFGYRNGGARDYAINLGVALQLTNIVRDVKADLARGRLYVPLDDLARFGCTEDDLRAGVVSARVAALLKHQCDRARGFYASARAALPREDARRLVAAEVMRATYFAILRRIERAGYDVFSRVVRVPRPARLAIAAAAWARTMAGWGR